MRALLRFCLIMLLQATAYPSLQDGLFYAGSDQVVFEGAVVWLEPSEETGKPIGWLPAGAAVEIIGETGSACEQEGYIASWYRVGWWYDGEFHQGYVPGPRIAVASLELEPDSNGVEALLVIGLTGVDQKWGRFRTVARLLRGDSVFASVEFPTLRASRSGDLFPSYWCYLREVDSSGLLGARKVFVFSIEFGDEGYECYEYILVLTDNALVAGPSTHSWSFSGEPEDCTVVTMPSDSGGIENSIVLNRVVNRWDARNGAIDTLYQNRWSYRWDGSGFLFLGCSE